MTNSYFITCSRCGDEIEVPAELISDYMISEDGKLRTIPPYCCDACEEELMRQSS
jgi:hypothetical protein